MESSKRGYRVYTMLVISFTSRLRTAIVSSIIVFGHPTAHAMHTCKSERAHPSAIIFLDNNIANNDIVIMMTEVMITKRNEKMEPKSQNLSITSSSEIFYTSCWLKQIGKIWRDVSKIYIFPIAICVSCRTTHFKARNVLYQDAASDKHEEVNWYWELFWLLVSMLLLCLINF